MRYGRSVGASRSQRRRGAAESSTREGNQVGERGRSMGRAHQDRPKREKGPGSAR